MYYRQTKQGRWRYAESYPDPLTGKKREVSVVLDKNTNAAKKEAAAILAAKIQAKTPTAPSSMTIRELVDQFIDYQYRMRKESTAQQDKNMLSVVVRLIGESARVSRITTASILAALDASGKDNVWKNQKIKHIKTLWRWAYKQGYVSDLSVIDRIERYPEPSNREKLTGKYLESDELREVIASMDAHTDYQLLTRFLALSGARIGEVIALTTEDINLEDKTIEISKTYALNTGKVQSTKTDMSARTLHLRPELEEVVRLAMRRQKQIRLAFGVTTNLLFPWKDGGFLHYEAYAKYFREHTEKVLGHALPVHSLRHTFTSLMAEAGVPIETISRQLGHADSKITRSIYMHVTKKIQQADNDRLDKVRFLS